MVKRGKKTKYLFVTGGVVSSLGKGLTSASIGMLLEHRGLRVRMQSLISLVMWGITCTVFPRKTPRRSFSMTER